MRAKACAILAVLLVLLLLVGGRFILRAVRERVGRAAAETSLSWLQHRTLPQLEAYKAARGHYPATLLHDTQVDFHPLSEVAVDSSGGHYHIPYGDWHEAPVSYATLPDAAGKPGQRFLLCAVRGAGGLGFPAARLPDSEYPPGKAQDWLEVGALPGHSLRDVLDTDDPYEALARAEARAESGPTEARQAALLEAAGVALYVNDRSRARELAQSVMELDADTEAGQFAAELLAQLTRIDRESRHS